jgi:excisionase family DNA binding protein
MTTGKATTSRDQGSDVLLRLGAAAALAAVSRPTLAAAIDRGELSAERLGSQRNVTRQALDAYLRACGRKPAKSRIAGPLVRQVVSRLPDGYAIGGYRAVHARHPHYLHAATSTTVWVTRRRFEDIVARSAPGDMLHDQHGRVAAVLRANNAESVRVIQWPPSLGRLVTERGNPDRVLTPDRLLVSFALEQALRAQSASADLETLTVLALEPGTDLAAALELLDRASRAHELLVLPLGTRSSSIVEVPISEAAKTARDLIASVLRLVTDVGASGAVNVRRGRRGEVRPLGRSRWRGLARRVPPARIERDRVLSLIASA